MPDYTVTINLPDYKRGDQWLGISRIGPVIIDGEAPSNTLRRMRMQFRKGTQVLALDSDGENPAIVVSNDETWEASVPPVDNFLPTAGDWQWDMEFYSEGSEAPLTLYKGTLRVHQDVTR